METGDVVGDGDGRPYSCAWVLLLRGVLVELPAEIRGEVELATGGGGSRWFGMPSSQV